MPNPTDQQVVTALARACGWRPGDFFPDRIVKDGGKLIDPLTSHDDAMAVQERLCGDVVFRRRFVNEMCTDVDGLSPDAIYDRFLALSSSDRCRALYVALPECGECGGSGEQIGAFGESMIPCPACDGTGKRTAG